MPKEIPFIHFPPNGAHFRLGKIQPEAGVPYFEVTIEMRRHDEARYSRVKVLGVPDFGEAVPSSYGRDIARTMVATLNAIARLRPEEYAQRVEQWTGITDASTSKAMEHYHTLIEAEAGLEFAAAMIGQHGPVGEFMPSHLLALGHVRRAISSESKTYLVPLDHPTPGETRILEFMMQRQITVGWNREGDMFTLYGPSEADGGGRVVIDIPKELQHSGNWRAGIVHLMQAENSYLLRGIGPIPDPIDPPTVAAEQEGETGEQMVPTTDSSLSTDYRLKLKPTLGMGKALHSELMAGFNTWATTVGVESSSFLVARHAWDIASRRAIKGLTNLLQRHLRYAKMYDHLRTADPDEGAHIAVVTTSGWGRTGSEPLYRKDADARVKADMARLPPGAGRQ